MKKIVSFLQADPTLYFHPNLPAYEVMSVNDGKIVRHLPDDLNAGMVLNVLREIRAEKVFSHGSKSRLSATVQAFSRAYYGYLPMFDDPSREGFQTLRFYCGLLLGGFSFNQDALTKIQGHLDLVVRHICAKTSPFSDAIKSQLRVSVEGVKNDYQDMARKNGYKSNLQKVTNDDGSLNIEAAEKVDFSNFDPHLLKRFYLEEVEGVSRLKPDGLDLEKQFLNQLLSLVVKSYIKLENKPDERLDRFLSQVLDAMSNVCSGIDEAYGSTFTMFGKIIVFRSHSLPLSYISLKKGDRALQTKVEKAFRQVSCTYDTGKLSRDGIFDAFIDVMSLSQLLRFVTRSAEMKSRSGALIEILTQSHNDDEKLMPLIKRVGKLPDLLHRMMLYFVVTKLINKDAAVRSLFLKMLPLVHEKRLDEIQTPFLKIFKTTIVDYFNDSELDSGTKARLEALGKPVAGGAGEPLKKGVRFSEGS